MALHSLPSGYESAQLVLTISFLGHQRASGAPALQVKDPLDFFVQYMYVRLARKVNDMSLLHGVM